MRPRSMAKTFKGTVMEILGTAVSSWVATVEGQSPKAVQEQIGSWNIKISLKNKYR